MSTNLLENTCKLESSTGMINVEVVCHDHVVFIHQQCFFFIFTLAGVLHGVVDVGVQFQAAYAV